ncbi:MAG: zinc metalloprotease HtpX [Alphaproteobacteria bacterium]|nr:zinc metalloprotease HtpX [Alphaproteobacteria bacterium]
MGRLKTFVLMFVLVLIFMTVGELIGGAEGGRVAFWMAVVMNFFGYFFSDKMVLRQYRARQVQKNNAPELYEIVESLSQKAELPMPKVYIIDEKVPNAFATGRNPSHAAVAVTTGLLELMNRNEIEGVLAHEMSHIKNYDILTSSIATVFASAIGMLSNMGRYNTVPERNRKGGGLAALVGVVLMPVAATIIRFSISRTREYAADEGSARLTKHPQWLISALSKLEGYAKQALMKNTTNETAHMFIINPLSGGNFAALFSTHPSTKDRIERLEKIAREL